MESAIKYIAALCLLMVVSGCAKAKVYYPGNGSFNATTSGIQADAQIYLEKVKQLEQVLVALSETVDKTEAMMVAETAVRESASAPRGWGGAPRTSLLHNDMDMCRLHVAVKTACESDQTLSVQRYQRQKTSDSFLTWASKDPTLLARNGTKRAMYRGRYGIHASSHTAPQPHPRARHKVPARRRRSGRTCVRCV